MSFENGWCALLAWLKVMRGTIAIIAIVAGGILYAADDRYVQNEDFSEKLDSMDENIADMKEQMQGLSVSVYESQLVQTELAIAELEEKEPRTHQEQRRLQELRIKRRTLVNRLRTLQGANP